MKFRVTSIAGPENGPLIRDATVRLQDWLNATLEDGEFGLGLEKFTFIVVSVFDEPEENERWAKAHRKLGSFTHQATGERVRDLCAAAAIPPQLFGSQQLVENLEIICRAMRAEITQRPKRLPKGFEYERFAAAVNAALEVYVPA